MVKVKSCMVTSPEADIIWDFLEERRKQAGVDTLEEMALRIMRTAMGLPPEYNIIDMRDVENTLQPRRLHVVRSRVKSKQAMLLGGR